MAGYKFKSASIAEVLKELEVISMKTEVYLNNKLNFKKDIVFKSCLFI